MSFDEVIVTGARLWPRMAYPVIWQVLAAHNPKLVVHGGCVEGADEMAERWARNNDVDSRIVRARWTADTGGKLDRSAGPRRNRRMLELFPDRSVLAFPYGNSKGTGDCIRQAVELGHPVLVFGTDGELVPTERWLQL